MTAGNGSATREVTRSARRRRRSAIGAVITTLAATTVALTSIGAAPSVADTPSRTVAIAKEATGFRITEAVEGTPENWEKPSYVDTGWGTSTVQAPFGSHVSSGGCDWNQPGGAPGYPRPNTVTPTDTTQLIRRHFTLPAGATDVRITGAVDNQVSFYVNGNSVGSRSGGYCNRDLSGEEGGAFDFLVDPGFLVAANDNVLAAEFTDTGGVSYLGFEVTYVDTGVPCEGICSFVAATGETAEINNPTGGNVSISFTDVPGGGLCDPEYTPNTALVTINVTGGDLNGLYELTISKDLEKPKPKPKIKLKDYEFCLSKSAESEPFLNEDGAYTTTGFLPDCKPLKPEPKPDPKVKPKPTPEKGPVPCVLHRDDKGGQVSITALLRKGDPAGYW